MVSRKTRFLSFFLLCMSVYWLFLIGWLLSWHQDGCYCSCRHQLLKKIRTDHSLENFLKVRRLHRLHLVLHWPKLYHLPISKPTQVKENGITHDWLRLIKILPLGWGWEFKSRFPWHKWPSDT